MQALGIKPGPLGAKGEGRGESWGGQLTRALMSRPTTGRYTWPLISSLHTPPSTDTWCRPCSFCRGRAKQELDFLESIWRSKGRAKQGQGGVAETGKATTAVASCQPGISLVVVAVPVSVGKMCIVSFERCCGRFLIWLLDCIKKKSSFARQSGEREGSLSWKKLDARLTHSMRATHTQPTGTAARRQQSAAREGGCPRASRCLLVCGNLPLLCSPPHHTSTTSGKAARG